MYSAFASLLLPFPLEPVYLLNTSPCPKYALLRFSNQDAKSGSYAALTSEESMRLRLKHLLSFSSL